MTGRVGLGADARTLTTEGVPTCRVVNRDADGTCLDLLGGVRYMSNRADLRVERNRDEIAGPGQSLDWVDAFVGARFRSMDVGYAW